MRVFRRLRIRTSDADRGTVLIQAVKAATAAVLAWVLATMVFALPQPFLAPYAAVFMIEATVSRSLRVAAEQLAAVSLGVVLAAAVGALVDSITVGVGIAVLVGLLLGRWRRLGSSGIWVAVTALLMVTYGAAEDPGVLGFRIVEIALGAATGVAVNALFLPPLYVKRSQRVVTGVGVTAANLLAEVPEELRGGARGRAASWNERSAQVRSQLDEALEAVAWTEESARGNLRSAASPALAAKERWGSAVVALSEAWPQCAEILRAAELTIDPHPPFDPLPPPIGTAAAEFVQALAEVIRTSFGVDAEYRDRAAAVRTARRRLRRFEEVVARHDSQTTGSSMSAGSLLRPCAPALNSLAGGDDQRVR